jgi:hypothetical protein
MAQGKDFACRQCGRHFNSRAELERHIATQHSSERRSASSSGSSGERDSREDRSSSSVDEQY